MPFRMAVPGLGRRSFDELVANIDIAPTLVDLAGDDSDHDFAGRSLDEPTRQAPRRQRSTRRANDPVLGEVATRGECQRHRVDAPRHCGRKLECKHDPRANEQT